MSDVKLPKAGWYNAFRPWTLHGAIVPVLIGGAYSYVMGSRDWFLFTLALIGGILLQSAANLLNTYGDYKTGLDTEENHTRSPELVSGILTAKSVLYMGLACLGIVALLGLIMIYLVGYVILFFGIAGLIGAGFYTIGISYKYIGLGQISVFVMMGVLMPAGTYYLLCQDFSFELFLIGLSNAMMITAVLGGNELRDFESDSAAGVKTLSYRLGYEKAMILYLSLMTLPYVVIPILVVTNILPWTSLLMFLSLPFWYKTYTNSKTARENKRSGFMLVPFAFKQNWVFGVLLVIGYLINFTIL